MIEQFVWASFPAAGITVASHAAEPSRWGPGEGVSAVWEIEGSKLPHKDFIGTPETYMDIGEARGRAMSGLMKK